MLNLAITILLGAIISCLFDEMYKIVKVLFRSFLSLPEILIRCKNEPGHLFDAAFVTFMYFITECKLIDPYGH